MQRALFVAASGMAARQLSMNTIANNLANLGTSGYKKRRAEFQDLLYQTMQAAGAPTSATTLAPSPIEVGLGVRPMATAALFQQGDLQNTANPLDIAIEGRGFFAVRQAGGELGYTRAGSFRLDAQGQMVTPDGDPVEPAITVPSETLHVQIGRDGTVSAILPGDGPPQVLGQLELTSFVNPTGLASMGRNLFSATVAAGEATTAAPGEDGAGQLAQGFLEMSNVDVVQEFVDMILSQRGYEAIAKVLRSVDEMYSTANQATR